MRHRRLMWYLYAIAAMVCLSIMILVFTRLRFLGITPPVILIFVFGFGFLFYAIQLFATKETIILKSQYIVLLLICALCSYVGNLLYVKTLDIAPNPGYVVAIIGSQALIISIASVFLFGSQFSVIKGVGVLLCTIGIVLLAL